MTIAHVFAFMALFSVIYAIYLCVKEQDELNKPYIWRASPEEIKRRQQPKPLPQYNSIWG